MSRVAGCELCEDPGGLPVWADAHWRVVRVDDATFPAFYRVVSVPHVAEFSDLAEADRTRCMTLVAGVEQVLRRELAPAKVNLASLGNVVPHLHWHVIARFHWDSHFPQPIWAPAQRAVEPGAAGRLARPMDALDAAVRTAVAGLG
jgi:diadenosine tetraphosphate (Ap4A) HIT family hydrolase